MNLESAFLGRTRPRLLIADDHAMFADALRVYLEKTYTVIGIVNEGRSLVSEAVRLRPDAIVLEVCMPMLNGLDAAKRIKEQILDVKFIFLTMQDDPNLAAAALELGAVGVVLKNSTGLELLEAINQVLSGKPYLTAKLRARDWASSKAKAKQYSKLMTPRQREVLQLIAEGRPAKEVADLLDLSEKTVHFHKQRIRESFNLTTNADMVLFALRQGLIAPYPA
ncbi:MAG TPA: response regulator transcription factor [Candidatus Sulfotelmatobacter sp.]|nr:response regulator transcription factor [Candidatus Sulfotelmatobacter sp.]